MPVLSRQMQGRSSLGVILEYEHAIPTHHRLYYIGTPLFDHLEEKEGPLFLKWSRWVDLYE